MNYEEFKIKYLTMLDKYLNNDTSEADIIILDKKLLELDSVYVEYVSKLLLDDSDYESVCNKHNLEVSL